MVAVAVPVTFENVAVVVVRGLEGKAREQGSEDEKNWRSTHVKVLTEVETLVVEVVSVAVVTDVIVEVNVNVDDSVSVMTEVLRGQDTSEGGSGRFQDTPAPPAGLFPHVFLVCPSASLPSSWNLDWNTHMGSRNV